MTNLASARRERAPSSAAVRSRKSRELPQLAGYQGWTRSRGQPGHLLVVVASRRSDGLRLVLLLGCRGRRWLLRPGTRRRIWAHGICGSGARRRRQRQPRGERHQRRVLCSGGAVRPSTDACLAEDELHLMQQWGTLVCDVRLWALSPMGSPNRAGRGPGRVGGAPVGTRTGCGAGRGRACCGGASCTGVS